MAVKTEAYVDTAALIAFADGSDTHHPLFRRLFADPPALITTTLVLAEGHGWFLRRFDSTRALQFLAMIEAMRPLSILAVGRREVTAATDLLRRFSDQALTMVDAVGLHVMATRSAPVCWSTDFHLSLTGVPLIIHQR
ncbi:MAG: type II toxin-antitoxin system VapC family toxin [Gammaproteobacteria bacterium]